MTNNQKTLEDLNQRPKNVKNLSRTTNDSLQAISKSQKCALQSKITNEQTPKEKIIWYEGMQ
jgi:hypothetical protein